MSVLTQIGTNTLCGGDCSQSGNLGDLGSRTGGKRFSPQQAFFLISLIGLQTCNRYQSISAKSDHLVFMYL